MEADLDRQFQRRGRFVAANVALSGEMQRSQEALKIAMLIVEKLKVEVVYLRRMKYGSL